MNNKGSIESNFFVFDSENLASVQTELYGYCVANHNAYCPQEEEIREHTLASLNPEDYPDGAYVLIQSNDKEIKVSQDFNGCFGLYIYQKNNYFAVSNSFTMLTSYLKDKVRLSLDYDYTKTYFLSGLAATAYTETMVKEITCLPKNARIIIDKVKKTAAVHYIDYQENTVSIASAEGMRILDNWFYKWTNIIRYLKSKTNKINVDLSGGMDSRLVFLLFAKAGINLNEVNIRSIKDDLHTHTEDYEIASRIAEFFHCRLNVSSSENKKTIPLSLEEFINLTSYVRLCFCTEMYYKTACHEKPLYAFCGNGGEALRKHWDVTPKQFIRDVNKRGRAYDDVDYSSSVEKILNHAFSVAKDKYHVADGDSPDVVDGFYKETRVRSHFGKAMAENSVCNVNTMAPLLDSTLAKICLKDCKTTNRNIIIAVIFERYCPELLQFKFDSGRSIETGIIKYAKELNGQFPFVRKNPPMPGQCVLQAKRIHNALTPKPVTNLQAKQFITRCFLSQKTCDLFSKYFNKSIYVKAKEYSKIHDYHPEARMIPVLGAVKIISDLTKQAVHLKEKQPAAFFNWLAEYPLINSSTRFADDVFRTARIDIKNVNANNNDSDMSILLKQNRSTVLRKPAWYHKNGIGYTIETCLDGSLDFSAVCLDEGEFTLFLRGLDINDKQKKRINVFIDYKKLIINGEEIFSRLTPISHDNFFVYKLPARKGQAFNIHVEWERHLYSAQEYLSIIKSQLPDDL